MDKPFTSVILIFVAACIIIASFLFLWPTPLRVTNPQSTTPAGSTKPPSTTPASSAGGEGGLIDLDVGLHL